MNLVGLKPWSSSEKNLHKKSNVPLPLRFRNDLKVFCDDGIYVGFTEKKKRETFQLNHYDGIKFHNYNLTI